MIEIQSLGIWRENKRATLLVYSNLRKFCFTNILLPFTHEFAQYSQEMGASFDAITSVTPSFSELCAERDNYHFSEMVLYLHLNGRNLIGISNDQHDIATSSTQAEKKAKILFLKYLKEWL